MTEQRAPAVEPALSFDRFQVLPRQRLLVEAGRPVRIGSRAFDILLALLERPGERVGKAELLARVWPGTHIVEGNLKFQVAALRRVLRDGQDGRRFIETSQGQGYCFVTPVAVIEGGERPVPPPVGAAQRHNLPEQLTPLVGRGEVVARLTEQLSAHRLLTIVGPGGIGKTSVALAMAERMIGAYEDGVWVVDLTRTADPDQVQGAVAAAVGLEAGPGMTTQDLVAALRGRRMLLVLDNCMHVVDAAAALVAAILRGAPHVRILATSREPLHTEGEHLCRLAPLETPPPSHRIGAAEALRYPSVQLFVEQAAASLEGFELTDGDAPFAAEICRKLDGIPLAIELAAARVGVLGVGGLAAQLDDRLRLLTGGHRTALPRHRTMRAALDWSYDLLSPPEQTILRCLAVFAGGFTLAAAAVAADEAHPGDEVVRLVLELAEKSLVVADLSSPGPRFRLLDTTRAYALEKARAGGEVAALARRHATYFLELLEAAARERAEGDERYSAVERDVDNLRAALAWAFAPAGDPVIGVCLAAASQPLWISTSLLGEAHAWSERAIERLDGAGLRGSRQEMTLQAALGISLQIIKTATSEAHAALSRALALAERHRDADCQLHVLNTLWVYHTRIGEVGRALNLARRAEAIAASMADLDATATAKCLLGIAMHLAGEHRSARFHLERLLRGPPPGPRGNQIRRAAFDPQVTTRYILGHVLWVQGYPDQAAEAVRIAVEDARRLQHPVTLCSTLAWGACALALLAGDLDAAWRSAAELVHHAEKHALADHLSYGLAAQGIISLRKAGPEASVEQVRAALERWHASQWHVFLGVGDFTEAAAAAGLAGEISAIVDEGLRRAERDQDLWAYPEALRVRGELLLLQDAPDPGGARRCFVRSLERARAQGAVAWQLRSAVSLHRLDLRQGDAHELREVLAQAYGRFGEGFDTADLRAARQLLAGRRERGPAEREGAARAL